MTEKGSSLAESLKPIEEWAQNNINLESEAETVKIIQAVILRIVFISRSDKIPIINLKRGIYYKSEAI